MRKKNTELVFIQTGGTIDKDYPHTTGGWAFEFGEPASTRILEQLNPSFKYKLVTAFQKDSLEIEQEDRQKIVDIIIAEKSNKIIITHGTDTMIETASFISERIMDKLVIITGSMLPERFTNSDAAINLGLAIGAANVLEKGVFICMNGIVKSPDRIKRDMNTGKFY